MDSGGGVVVSTVTWQQKVLVQILAGPSVGVCSSPYVLFLGFLQLLPRVQNPWADGICGERMDGRTERCMIDGNSRGESRIYGIFHKSKFPSKNLSILNWKKMLKYSNVSSKSRLKPSGCMKETFPEVKLKSELAGRWVTEQRAGRWVEDDSASTGGAAVYLHQWHPHIFYPQTLSVLCRKCTKCPSNYRYQLQ